MAELTKMMDIKTRILGRRYAQDVAIPSNHFKELNFVNSWSLRDKKNDYDALIDPHASYYFANRSVKNHLKYLKHAIKDQKNVSEQKKLKKFITQKIKQKFTDVLCPKTSVYQKQMKSIEFLTEKGKKSLKSLHSSKSKDFRDKSQKYFLKKNHSREKTMLPQIKGQLQSLNQSISNQKNPLTNEDLENIENLEEESRTEDKKTITKTNLNLRHRQKANKLTEELHQKRHDKFVQFIEEKKKILASSRLPIHNEQEKKTSQAESKTPNLS